MMTTVEANSDLIAIRSHLGVKAPDSLYVIVDACQASELVDVARSEFKQPTRMLFKGAAASFEEIESVAPFFIPVDMETDFLEHWLTFLGKSAGILFVSNAEPREIFRHLRKIFVVQDEKGQEHFFRFYDPRVLRIYLTTCTPEELAQFFGPMKRIVLEGENPNMLVAFDFERGELKRSSLKLTGQASAADGGNNA
jgi:hypothetical protein